MKVEKIFLSERPLYDIYRFDFCKIKDFFQYDPYTYSSFEQRYHYIKDKGYERLKLAQILKEYNTTLGVSKKTLENIEKLKDPETVAVITGQQAGVLTGPLYTIYKAMTAINLAKWLGSKGIPAIPLFWIASEDHDFQEISGISLLDKDNREVNIKLELDVYRKPIGKIKLRSEVEAFLREFMVNTPETEFKARIMERIFQAAEASSNLADWFGRIMAILFAETGLIFVDALLPDLRDMGKVFFKEIFLKNDLITSALRSTSNYLEKQGFSSQVSINQNQIHLFLIEGEERYPLEKIKDRYQLRNHNRLLTETEIINLIDENPRHISTNVVTRPLFQDYLFPTIAYVAGPGEISYYAQFKQIYQVFNMEMPIIYPRASITLVEPSVARNLKNYELSPLQIFQEFNTIKEKYLLERDKINLKAKFSEVKGIFIPKYQKLIHELTEMDEKFKNLGKKNLQRIIEEINYLENKANQQHRKNCELLLNQLNKIKVNLHPDEVLQERKYNIFPYLFKYKLTLITELLNLNFLPTNFHYIIYL